MAPKAGLWRGHYTDVATLTDAERKEKGLSSNETIHEVMSDGTAQGDLAAVALVRRIDKYIRAKGITAFDTETGPRKEFEHEERAALDPFKAKIVLMQLGDEDCQFLLWWQTLPPEAKTIVYALLADPEVRKIGVNLKFDWKMMLGNEGMDLELAGHLDTQILEQVLCCGLTGDIGFTMKLTGMGAMAKRWLGLLLVKDEEIRTNWHKLTPGKWWPSKDELHEEAEGHASWADVDRVYEALKAEGQKKRYYAADDVCVPLTLLEKQVPWIMEFELQDTVKLEMDFLPCLADMECRGLLLEQTQWQALAADVKEKYKEAVRALDRLFHVTVSYRVDMDGNVIVTRDKNYGSKDELRDLIHEWMRENTGVEVICNNKQFKEALLRAGMNPMRLEKLFEKRLVDDPKNPGKRKQVAYPGMTDLIEGSEYTDALWERLQPRLPEGTFAMPSTDSKLLKLMRILHEAPKDEIEDIPEIPTKIGLPPELVTPVLAFREFGTKLSRYAYSWLDMVHPVTNRIHSDFTQTCADTGRLTSRPNFQNLPGLQIYRTAVCQARPGHRIVGADFSQIEPRIIAELSFCETYMKVFWSEKPGTPGFEHWCGDDVTEPLDLYGAVGAAIGIMPPDGAKKSVAKQKDNKEISAGRKKAKIGVLGLGYGTGKAKFYIQYLLDTGVFHRKSESDSLFDGFWSTAAEVKETLDALSAISDPDKSKRRKYHPFADKKVTWAETIGLRKRFFDGSSRAWWTQSRNMPIQGAGADILKKTVVELRKRQRERGIEGWVLLTAHDELVGEAPDAHAEAYAKLMEEVMSDVGQMYCPHVPITAEAYTADHWVKD